MARMIRKYGDILTCCDFTPCSTGVVVGMVGGRVKVYNSKNGNECITHYCHENTVRYVKCSKNGTLLLTSSFHTQPGAKMWNIEQNQFLMKLHFAGDEYLEFSNLNEDKIVGTKATVDGVLWDVRSGEQIYKFEMSSQTFSGVFYPNALEIVSDDKVWDMRTLRLLRTVPELEGSMVKFSPQNVIYAVGSETRYLLGITPIRTLLFMSQSFKTLDGNNYSTIKIKNAGGRICDLCVNRNGSEIALVENRQTDSVLRIYSVGKRKEEDDEDDTGGKIDFYFNKISTHRDQISQFPERTNTTTLEF
ncbi:Protein mahjong [Pseudolycoriella hygida]|uniref:Protein mahjong n=1 Tax=Pseudolycoriella hygida TaxID=35572 RepID=A0A9Q0S5B6_9DIPT|nr:Protein mahjong [Pseudolycoriella hygida]